MLAKRRLDKMTSIWISDIVWNKGIWTMHSFLVPWFNDAMDTFIDLYIEEKEQAQETAALRYINVAPAETNRHVIILKLFALRYSITISLMRIIFSV